MGFPAIGAQPQWCSRSLRVYSRSEDPLARVSCHCSCSTLPSSSISNPSCDQLDYRVGITAVSAAPQRRCAGCDSGKGSESGENVRSCVEQNPAITHHGPLRWRIVCAGARSSVRRAHRRGGFNSAAGNPSPGAEFRTCPQRAREARNFSDQPASGK
jgi:hypothetical protein